ncbi:MAG: hypothetical protein ABS76_27410 [Pelagibacterium sp. SCN 64-44]|nr:MAG: hypothetical protein ABS76_27410 [Pelagibacterium sp. SCN 64-44]
MDAPLLSPHLLHFARSRHSEPPRHLGTRHDANGVFLTEAGNTIVCHVKPGTPTEAALRAARRRYMAMPEARQFAFTAEDSLHMTLFQGVLGRNRRLPFWPEGVALDTPLEAMDELFLERLDRLEPGAAFKVSLIEAAPSGLIVEGATAADRHAMADWRNRLADLFGYRHPDHDHYVFHITFTYPITWLDDEVLPAWQDMLAAVAEDIRQQAPVLDLRAPAFCRFRDMNLFEEIRVLEPARA